MKRLTLEATDENVLDSIRENTYGRNEEVKSFIEALEMLEGNMFISVDARWGEGKTFFVRQVEKTLIYASNKKWPRDEEHIKDLDDCFKGTKLCDVKLSKSYLPVYYNAWLNDNQEDPLMSLVLTISKKAVIEPHSCLSESLGEKILKLLPSVSFSMGRFTVAAPQYDKKDVLEKVKTAEEIREIVNNILDEVIVEQAERLVIFVDELDRCRPSFAIEMLERIKHYFDDDRIMFVVSVNKEQLVHTISKYYGYGFDSSGYLNKFFDYNAHIGFNDNNWRKDSFTENKYAMETIAEDLSDYYRLTLRDCLIYKQRLSSIPQGCMNLMTASGCCRILFVPLIVILDIVNQEEKKKFLNGDSLVLKDICKNAPNVGRLIGRLQNNKTFNCEEETIEILINTYKYIFGKSDRYEHPSNVFDVEYNLKEQCIKLSSGYMR